MECKIFFFFPVLLNILSSEAASIKNHQKTIVLKICGTLYLICKKEKESTKKNQELKAIFIENKRIFLFLSRAFRIFLAVKQQLA